MRKVGAVLAAISLLGALAAAARADVCAKTDLGLNCAGPGGGRTTVTAQGGCCVFVDSTGPVQVGRTGVVGTGIGGRSATITLYGNGHEAARADAEPDRVTLHLQAGDASADLRAHAGCCLDGSISGPVPVGRTGLHGDERLEVWVDGRRGASCPPDERAPRCRIELLR